MKEIKHEFIVGITNDNELYIIELTKNSCPQPSFPNGYFSTCGRSLRLSTTEQAKEDAKQYWESFFDENSEEYGNFCKRFRPMTIEEAAQFVLDNDGEYHGMDVDWKFGEVTIEPKKESDPDTETYVLTYSGCGQHDAFGELKHTFQTKQFCTAVQRLWKKYHMKEIPQAEWDKLLSLAKKVKVETAIRKMVALAEE